MVAGIRAQFGYASNVQTTAYNFGNGRFIFNTLRIRDQLGKDPVAELLLRNLLNFAVKIWRSRPPICLPTSFRNSKPSDINN